MARSIELPVVSYAEASGRVREWIAARIPAHSAKNISSETVALESAAGRVLAAGLRADRDQPPFPRSTRDGFACRAADANHHEPLRLAGQVRAGQSSSGVLGEGEAWEIMTGAAAPEGADAVFMVEHAEVFNEQVRLDAGRTIRPGENIVPQGAEARACDLLVPHGVRIGGAHIALAAQCGYSELEVAVLPRVAILSTGDELVPVEVIPGPSQIRNSNSPMLAALVRAAGATPVMLPAVPDEETAVDAAIGAVLSPAGRIDLLLISGGISAGRFDLVEEALRRAGAEFLFHGVAMQPGKPAAFGQIPRPGIDDSEEPLPFFALPGNPISSAATFYLFAAPLLAALAGCSVREPRFAAAELGEAWRGKPGLTRFLPAFCNFNADSGRTPQVRLIPWQGSGDLAAFARSNCMLVVPAEAGEIRAGMLVTILLT